MFYVFTCTDKAGSGDIRAANRTAHLAYLESFGDMIFAAGPTLTDDGSAMTGSVLTASLHQSSLNARSRHSPGMPLSRITSPEPGIALRYIPFHNSACFTTDSMYAANRGAAS